MTFLRCTEIVGDGRRYSLRERKSPHDLMPYSKEKRRRSRLVGWKNCPDVSLVIEAKWTAIPSARRRNKPSIASAC